jgi:hypothetical protein
MLLLALAGTAAVAALVREVKSPRRVRAIQTVPVRDVGSQTLTVVHDEPDAELRRLGFELRAVLDAGTQRLHPEAVPAGKERAGA